jgi:transcription antitermination protein NusB
LFEQELKSGDSSEILKRYRSNPGFEFAKVLVNGVNDHKESLDRLISERAKDWTLDRMPVIDKNLLRMALFEMLHLDEVPSAVAINEAVDLAKTYSTEGSSRFVNGLLAAVRADREAVNVDNPPSTV